MKKILSLILCAVMLIAFSACGKKAERFHVYFKNANENSLSTEIRNMEVKNSTTEEDRAKFVISQIIAGPSKEQNSAVISSEAKLLSLAIKNSVATVNISKEFSEKKDVEALILRLSVVKSLCEIKGIDGVVIQVEGKPLVSEATGKELGVLNAEDIAFDTNSQKAETSDIILYFPDEAGEGLVRETREVEIQNALSPEKTVISELIKGPDKKELLRAVPAETKLLNIETKDGVCFVNFSSEFVTKTDAGSLSTMLTLYSVVNSLCELDSVKSVQILVNGETGVEFGNYVLDIPYEKEESIIK